MSSRPALPADIEQTLRDAYRATRSHFLGQAVSCVLGAIVMGFGVIMVGGWGSVVTALGLVFFAITLVRLARGYRDPQRSAVMQAMFEQPERIVRIERRRDAAANFGKVFLRIQVDSGEQLELQIASGEVDHIRNVLAGRSPRAVILPAARIPQARVVG